MTADEWSESDTWPTPARYSGDSKVEATFHGAQDRTESDAGAENAAQPTGDAEKAREALVQRIAEALLRVEWPNGSHATHKAVRLLAPAVLPVVAAEVEAATATLRDQWEVEVSHCHALGKRVEREVRAREKAEVDLAIEIGLHEEMTARWVAAESALRQVREDLTALADEHAVWMTVRVPADDLDERNQHRGLVAGVRTVLARVGAGSGTLPVADRPADPAADTQPEGAGEATCLCGEVLRPGFGWHSCNAGRTPTAGSKVDTAPEAWECQHKPRCADAACSHNPAIQQWIKGGQ